MTRTAWIAGALLALGGCPSVSVAPEGRPCETDEHCGAGAVCDPATKTCVKQAAVDQLPPGDGPVADAAVDVSTPDAADSGGDTLAPDVSAPDADGSSDTLLPDAAGDLPGLCGPGTCQGCCQGNVCIVLSAQSATVCGQGGQACQSCDDGEECTTETCGPGVCQVQNKPNGTTCDDQQDCTYNDQCTGGSCSGTLDTCSDGLTCTSDICTGLAPPAHCVNALLPGQCLIATACVADKVVSTSNSCNQCNPSVSAWVWTAAQGCVSTLAGSGSEAFVNGPLLAAAFDDPTGIAVDSSGKVYVAGRDNHAIRVIEGDKVTTLAGTGQPGLQDGPVAGAMFNEPWGVAVDSAGKVYVADKRNHRIRVISGGVVSTLAGTGAEGSVDGPATAVARFNDPTDVAVDSTGKVYVAGNDDNKIRVISGGVVTTLAGTGSAGYLDGPAAQAQLDHPQGVVVDGAFTVYVADTDNNCIRKISGGVVTTVAGQGPTGAGLLDGPVATALLSLPFGIALDGPTIYFSEIEDGNNTIRKVAGGVVTTLVAGPIGYKDGPLATARMDDPYHIDVLNGVIYVIDADNNRVRLIRP